VVSGAGSAALACANLYVLLGINPDNIIMFDKDGVISSERNDLSALQKKYSKGKPGITLGDALKGADVFLGLSAGNILTPDMLLGMANDPIVFAMANPDPEIEYNLAISTRRIL
jgi:malate dehydrogenase (oxaloacetate-decarboxylating)(NADP+)